MRYLALFLITVSFLAKADLEFYGNNNQNFYQNNNTLYDSKGNQYNNSNNNYGVKENTYQINTTTTQEDSRRHDVLKYKK